MALKKDSKYSQKIKKENQKVIDMEEKSHGYRQITKDNIKHSKTNKESLKKNNFQDENSDKNKYKIFIDGVEKHTFLLNDFTSNMCISLKCEISQLISDLGMEACLSGEKIAIANSGRFCYKNLYHVCSKTKAQIKRQDLTVIRYKTDGKLWLIRSFMFSYFRLIDGWKALNLLLLEKYKSFERIESKYYTKEIRYIFYEWQEISYELLNKIYATFIKLNERHAELNVKDLLKNNHHKDNDLFEKLFQSSSLVTKENTYNMQLTEEINIIFKKMNNILDCGSDDLLYKFNYKSFHLNELSNLINKIDNINLLDEATKTVQKLKIFNTEKNNCSIYSNQSENEILNVNNNLLNNTFISEIYNDVNYFDVNLYNESNQYFINNQQNENFNIEQSVCPTVELKNKINLNSCCEFINDYSKNKLLDDCWEIAKKCAYLVFNEKELNNNINILPNFTKP